MRGNIPWSGTLEFFQREQFDLRSLAKALSEREFFNEKLAIPVVRNYMSKQTEFACEQSTFTRCKQWHKLWHNHMLDSCKCLIGKGKENAVGGLESRPNQQAGKPALRRR